MRPETLLSIDPSPAHPRNSEGDIVELKDGRLCLVYTRFYGGAGDHAAAELSARVSADGGKTWGEDRVVVPNEGGMNVMSVSLLRLPDGTILLFYARKDALNALICFMRRSTDELQTVGPAVRVTTEDGYFVVNNGRAVRLSTGRILVPVALHPCPDGTQATWSGNGIPKCFLSDDDGATWKSGSPAVTEAEAKAVTLQEPGVIELADGRVWMWMRTRSGSQYGCHSRDGGATWTGPRPTALWSPCSPASIKRLPWAPDTLLAVYNDHSGWHVFPEGRRTPLCLALSRDEGRTWSPSRVLEGDPNGWYCYTSLTFLADDRLVISYCAGDRSVGGLNRLRVMSLPREWIMSRQAAAVAAG